MTSEYIEKIIECEFQRVQTIDCDCSVADGAMYGAQNEAYRMMEG